MSDEEALLAAIAAHPEEDTPRLAYADWLDEHDQPIRADFIRVQVEVARVETLPRIDLNQHVALFRRQQDLLEHHRNELIGPLPSPPESSAVDFDRGFLSQISFSVPAFINNQARLAALVPLPRIAIADSVHRVLSLFDRVAALDVERSIVSAVATRPDRRGARGASRADGFISPDPTPWPRLTLLELSGCRLGDEMAARLVQAAVFPALADLDLSANELTDDAIRPLLATGLPRQLRKLILGGNDITDVGARILTENWPADSDRLETLNLRFTHIGTPGRQALLARFGGRVDLF
jgi:uncharacterized protein (TIGR02996 family)